MHNTDAQKRGRGRPPKFGAMGRQITVGVALPEAMWDWLRERGAGITMQRLVAEAMEKETT